MSTLDIRCRCGAVTGTVHDVTPRAGVHVVCLCCDCQAYAHHLGRPDVLDEHGGTEVYQTALDRVTVHTGAEHIACLRLSPNGTLRWHTSCCNTPLGNTGPQAKVPFVGIPISIFVDGPEDRDAAMGPVVGYIQGRHGHGTLPEGTHDRAPLGLLLRVARTLAGPWWRGAGRDTLFFDADGQPRGEPFVISREARAEADARAARPPHLSEQPGSP